MRNRFVMLDGKEPVKVVSVTPEGELKRFVKVSLYTKKVGRHHAITNSPKNEVMVNLSKAIGDKVAKFKETQKKLKEYEAKERARIMNNVENWFFKANKLAID